MRKLALAILLLTLSACGGNGDAADERAQAAAATPAADYPVTVRADNGKVTLQQRPTRIVSLSATATEMLFAIEAGDQVVAADEHSDYPPEAPTTKLSGFEPNIEAIAKFEPDLVVIADEPGDLEASLEKLGIPVMLNGAAETLDDTYGQIERLGVATGHPAEAADLVATMQREIQEIAESVPDFDEAPTYYHELDDTHFSATSDTFIGQVYGLLGLRNIADGAKGAASQYPQLSAEYIVEQDPDIIFLADAECCGVTAEKVAKRPGWDGITAVETGAIVELDGSVASRWGPRVVEFVETVAEELRELEEANV